MTPHRSGRLDRIARALRTPGSTASRAAPALAAGLALLALGGCATLRSEAPFGGAPVSAAAHAPGDLAGEWRGSFNEIEAVLYEDEANLVLRIDRDGTFVERVTPGSGTNNLAKAATWTGVVEERGNQVILKRARGGWLTLKRSGDRLYGVAHEPLSEAPIAIRFRRESPSGYAAAPGFSAAPAAAVE